MQLRREIPACVQAHACKVFAQRRNTMLHLLDIRRTTAAAAAAAEALGLGKHNVPRVYLHEKTRVSKRTCRTAN